MTTQWLTSMAVATYSIGLKARNRESSASAGGQYGAVSNGEVTGACLHFQAAPETARMYDE